MKRAFVCAVCLCVTVVACFSGCAAPTSGKVQSGSKPKPVQADDAENSCLSYISREMMSDGGVFTNNITASKSEKLASGQEVLSESEGLMLNYYAASADRGNFDKTLDFIKSKLDSGTIISYRLREDGSRFPVNASVDDLRILRGLLEGAETFSEPAYTELCGQYEDRLFDTNVKNNLLLDYYDESSKSAGSLCTLCYSDLKTMSMLSKSDKRWIKIEKRMSGIVLGGYMGNAFPLFRMQYLPDTDSYTSGNIGMTEALITALHLSEVGKCPPETVNWLIKEISDGAVYGEYTEQGQAATKVESTSIYALCVLLGISENKPELVRAATGKLSALQITDKSLDLYGAFADTATGKAYSFDNLMALTALHAQTQYFAANEGDAK